MYCVGNITAVHDAYHSTKISGGHRGFMSHRNIEETFVFDVNKNYAAVFCNKETGKHIVRNFFQNSLTEKNIYFMDDYINGAFYLTDTQSLLTEDADFYIVEFSVVAKEFMDEIQEQLNAKKVRIDTQLALVNEIMSKAKHRPKPGLFASFFSKEKT